jgi:hypothetical protein
MRTQLLVTVTAALLAVAQPSQAQDEGRLRKELEGKRVTLKIEMPATSAGVDIFPGTGRPLDFQKYGSRLKDNGVAIKSGEGALITKVKVKGEHIEVHLNGGGYGTFGDALNEMNNQGADSGMAQQAMIANQRTQRAAAGSRFNLRYPNGVTSDEATVGVVVRALEEYATFPVGLGEPAPTPGPAVAARGSVSAESAVEPVRKGMSGSEVAEAVGAPVGTATNGQIVSRRYRSAGGAYEVDFVNDVAVAVRAMSTSSGPTLKKGLTLSEVEQIAGQPTASTTNDKIVTNKYNWQDGVLEADFYSGVLVAYRISSK